MAGPFHSQCIGYRPLRRFGVVLLLCCVVGLPPAPAVELPMRLETLTTKDHRVYQNARIVGMDAVGVNVTHDTGSVRIPFARLPRELAAQFVKNPEAADEQLRKEAAQTAAYERMVGKGVEGARKQKINWEEYANRPRPLISNPSFIPFEGLEERALSGKSPELTPRQTARIDRILLLDNHIKRCQAYIREIENIIIEREHNSAGYLDDEGRAAIRKAGEAGNLGVRYVPPTSGRGDTLLRLRREDTGKIEKTTEMIRMAEEEIRRLQLLK